MERTKCCEFEEKSFCFTHLYGTVVCRHPCRQRASSGRGHESPESRTWEFPRRAPHLLGTPSPPPLSWNTPAEWAVGKVGYIFKPHEAEWVAGESPGMSDKVIDRNVNRLPRLDVPQCRNHQIVVERIWTGGHNTKQHSTHVVKAAGQTAANNCPFQCLKSNLNKELNSEGLWKLILCFLSLKHRFSTYTKSIVFLLWGGSWKHSIHLLLCRPPGCVSERTGELPGLPGWSKLNWLLRALAFCSGVRTR